MKHLTWILGTVCSLHLGGCDLANRLSQEKRLGLVTIGEPTQIYSTPKATENVGKAILAGTTCLVTKVELQKNHAWFYVSCEFEGQGWIRGSRANRTYFPEQT